MTEKPVTLNEIMQMIYEYGNDRERRELPNGRRSPIRRALEPVFARAEVADDLIALDRRWNHTDWGTDAEYAEAYQAIADRYDATKGASG